ncbi:hypothetical protein C4B63_2g25 [Trypanosoma cruzi]|uniref:Uncharacterized protein n=1 Tax=Trypanosoma cruzi TaxID=5693 RepID=A0A2V2W0Z8_TRYCR|nr:hypothetical protein C4B63_2g25 [Trypanosoma cruzi]
MWLRRLPPTHSGAACSVTVLARWCSTQSGRGPEGKESSSKETTTTEGKSGGLSLTNTNSSVEKKGGFLQPSDDVVLEYARHALEREGRDKKPEAVIWQWDTTYSPILSKGKQNFYDYTDDIPKHVKPFWHHEYYQQREYFRLQREKRPLREQLKTWGIVVACLSVAGAALTLIRVWVEQPREIRELREECSSKLTVKYWSLPQGMAKTLEPTRMLCTRLLCVIPTHNSFKPCDTAFHVRPIPNMMCAAYGRRIWTFLPMESLTVWWICLEFVISMILLRRFGKCSAL